jgi:hypothetical protein
MKSEIADDLWAKLWLIQMAVQYILLDGEKMRDDVALASHIKDRIDLWFSGSRGALTNDEYLLEHLPNLSQVLTKIEDRFGKVNSVAELRLPPAVWFRIFYDLAIPTAPQSLIRLAWWQFSNEAKGRYLLYKYWDKKKNAHVGPMHEQAGKRGRTALDFLSAGLPAKISSQLHVLEWVVEAHESNKRSAPNQFPVPKKTMSSITKHPEKKKAEAKTAVAAKPRKRRNINALRTNYGLGCVTAVQEALDHQVERKQSLIVKGSSDNRPYSTSLGTSELIELLQRKHQAVARYSVSTLKPVIGYFVQTPRGRPSTLAERE